MKTAWFDLRALVEAVEHVRKTRRLKWKDVASQSGISAASLTRFKQGHSIILENLVSLVVWAGLSVDEFIRVHQLRYDLDGALNEAMEEGRSIPSSELIQRAESVIQRLYKTVPRQYSMYLMPEGEIAIDTRGTKPNGVLIILDELGRASCSGEQNQVFWQQNYVNGDQVPDGELLHRLRELD